MTVRWPLLLVALSATPAPAQRPGGLVPTGSAAQPTADVRFDEQIGAQLPLDLVLRNEKDEPITLGECIDGKPTILVLAYYRCPANCTKTLNGVVEVLRGMPNDYTAGNQFRVLTVSFDPKEKGDLARRKKDLHLQAYGRPGADAGWRFCTASTESIDKLTSTVGYHYEYDKVFKEYNHPMGLIILSPAGKVMRYFYGVQFDQEYTVKDGGEPTTVRLSLIEAADGKGGSLLDQLTLACFSWDTSTKKYTRDVKKIMRIGGVVTLLALVTGVGLGLARERRRKRTAALAEAPPTDRPTEGTT